MAADITGERRQRHNEQGEQDAWTQCWDAEEACAYYYNSRTGLSSWEPPAALALAPPLEWTECWDAEGVWPTKLSVVNAAAKARVISKEAVDEFKSVRGTRRPTGL